MDGKQTIVQISGDRGQLSVLILTLLIVSGLLMYVTISLSVLKDLFKETKTEVRILQMHMQDRNAILIREGILKKGDLTTGPTDPDKLDNLKVKK